MNIVLDINDYDHNNIFFQTPIKNTIMDKSNFIRIIYSNNVFTLNGILLKINLIMSGVERYFNKYKYTFNPNENKDVINKLIEIEKNILNRINIKNKNQICRISTQLQSGNIKLFTTVPIINKHTDYIVKISGIWESIDECGDYGITYKFIEAVCYHQ